MTPHETIDEILQRINVMVDQTGLTRLTTIVEIVQMLIGLQNDLDLIYTSQNEQE